MSFTKLEQTRPEREEFACHGFSDTVTLTHRNVCKDGFTVIDTVDALFLDIPAPWEAVEHATKALRKDRTTRICCFSPCMEQVLRTVTALNDAGFTDITMYETLLRPQDVTQTPALQPIGQVSEKLKKAERKREEKRLRQIALGRNRTNDHGSKRKREPSGEADEDPVGADVSLDTKRVKTDGEDETVRDEPVFLEDANHDNSEPTNVAKMTVSKAYSEVRGHTSYLTFACLVPTHPSLTEADKVDDTAMVCDDQKEEGA